MKDPAGNRRQQVRPERRLSFVTNQEPRWTEPPHRQCPVCAALNPLVQALTLTL